jgi:hypothetical protein
MMEEIGPVDYLIVAFPGKELQQLAQLKAQGS